MRTSKELEEAQARTEKALAEFADGLREMQVGHAEFERDMREGQARLYDGQARLQEGQLALQKSVREMAEGQKALTEAQGRTEARVEELAGAQARTEARLGELAQAQTRTEDALTQLAERTASSLGRLEKMFGQSIEEIAQEVVPFYLEHEEGIKLLWALGEEYYKVDGEEFEIDLAAEGRRGEETILVICEAKNKIDIRDVERFKGTVAKIAASTGERTHAVMFSSRLSGRAQRGAPELGVVIIPWQYRFRPWE